MLAVGIGIVAGAEQGEIVRRDPLQELHGLGDFVGGKRRRVGLQLRRHLARPGKHGLPVFYGNPDVGEDLFECA